MITAGLCFLVAWAVWAVTREVYRGRIDNQFVSLHQQQSIERALRSELAGANAEMSRLLEILQRRHIPADNPEKAAKNKEEFWKELENG